MIAEILTYIIQTTVSLTVFYILYELVFKNEPYFHFLRYYLLMAVIVSALLPLASINLDQMGLAATDYTLIIFPVHTLVDYTLSEVTIYANDRSYQEGINWSNINFPLIIIIIYFIGFASSIARLFYLTTKLLLLSYKYGVEEVNGLKLIRVPGVPTFSFFDKVFIDTDISIDKSDLLKVLSHEKVHINQKHTIDLLIIELIIAIQWFNPVAYLIRNRIKENHEFIADNDVVTNYSNIYSYSKLLIENSSIIKSNILTHNFSYSLLKRRLSMLEKQKRTNLKAIKLLWLVLAIVVVFFACSSPSNDAVGAKGDSNTPNKSVYTSVEKMPSFVGGHEKMVEYLTNNIKYPEKSKSEGVAGKVMVNFVIDENGDIIDVKVIKGVNSDLDEEAVRVVSSMPNWIPGENGGEAVKVSMNLPISFSLDENSNDIFTVVEEMPEYKGGRKAMITYLSENIDYPEEAKKNGVEGKVYVNFVIEENGEVSNVKVLRGIGYGCDKEAVDVINNMPAWIPGKQSGKPVRVSFNLPISFKLN